jgi:hypothetical protein
MLEDAATEPTEPTLYGIAPISKNIDFNSRTKIVHEAEFVSFLDNFQASAVYFPSITDVLES